ncbi:PGR5-like A protein [Tasmannia lanceolata]|uniref:PGR5-like A protein n=1 Tax=Tasmannia lanceolata TaxID=3420 RepID=UPI0040630F17
MAGTCTLFSHVTSSILELSRTGIGSQLSGSGASFYWKTHKKSKGFSAACRQSHLSLAEGPSCIFVGPIETASKETLEALYRQARDAYYSGKPLIVDDMFDKVELKLRWYGSKSVVKYPRCSLRRQSTYADAEEDPPQVLALASTWIFFLLFGSFLFLMPTFYTISLAYQDALFLRFSSNSARLAFDFFAILFMGLGFVIGYPIASASVRALEGLWRSDLLALKGSCPNCGEEVFAFVSADQSNQSPHRADCHVCECSLEFRTKVEESSTRPGERWVYGRIYLIPGTARKLRRW